MDKLTPPPQSEKDSSLVYLDLSDTDPISDYKIDPKSPPTLLSTNPTIPALLSTNPTIPALLNTNPTIPTLLITSIYSKFTKTDKSLGFTITGSIFYIGFCFIRDEKDDSYENY
ncbi:hypothetical protein PCH_Pc20g08720 [Penicillium rubens Wisconsin 54-1255]|uniref:Uncharacterized protein n=1 Tax=Penicillium rubens (strain ATCC 28089 / DSM 1075 / NRRL 1951 / Wisconsin 54-1255) TaxID=500485 RepID=B6HEZ6_PENRW|nr:hypothetical protein PCH_Pc20g08720 [Penicillium rubens Wisconsin 54-1255]